MDDAHIELFKLTRGGPAAALIGLASWHARLTPNESRLPEPPPADFLEASGETTRSSS